MDLDAAERNLERQTNFARAAETKINIVFPILALFFPTVAAVVVGMDKDSILNWVLFLCNLAALTLIFVSCMSALFPRFHNDRESLTFFVDISKYSPEEFSERINTLSDDEYFEQILFSTWANAKSAEWKFRQMRIAMAALYVELPLISLFLSLNLESLINGTKL